MSDIPFIPWRPGLPPAGTVCDVLDANGRTWHTLKVEVVNVYGRGPTACARILKDTHILPDGVLWRPIPIPCGVRPPDAPTGGTRTA